MVMGWIAIFFLFILISVLYYRFFKLVKNQVELVCLIGRILNILEPEVKGNTDNGSKSSS